jgi:hypothetical protein
VVTIIGRGLGPGFDMIKMNLDSPSDCLCFVKYVFNSIDVKLKSFSVNILQLDRKPRTGVYLSGGQVCPHSCDSQGKLKSFAPISRLRYRP